MSSQQVHVVAYDRPAAAHQLRLSGADWAEIAREVGYADGRIAALAVTAFLQRIAVDMAPEHRLEILETEMCRLDALQAGHWAAAVEGNIASALLVLKVIAQRCKLFGFDRHDNSLIASDPMVVIGGTEEEYITGITDYLAAQDERDRRLADNRQTPPNPAAGHAKSLSLTTRREGSDQR